MVQDLLGSHVIVSLPVWLQAVMNPKSTLSGLYRHFVQKRERFK
jgi:hypothetical protein